MIRPLNLKSCAIHVNLLPESYEQYEQGKYLLDHWATEAAGKEGKIELQHRVGKLKKSMFQKMAPAAYLQAMQKSKQFYDPHGLWSPGNML